MPQHNSARHRVRSCPDHKARLTHHPVEYLPISVDGVDLTIDKWRTIAAIIRSEYPPETLLPLAEAMAAYWRRSGDRLAGETAEITGQSVIDTAREFHSRGVFWVGHDGRAYMGEPIYDALGRVVGSKRLTDKFRAEVVEEMRRQFPAETGGGGGQ